MATGRNGEVTELIDIGGSGITAQTPFSIGTVSSPGREFHYCTKSFAVLGLILQEVSGTDVERIPLDEVFGP